jgi:tripartite-type tricarboxylate transporter receptor subunit TctC
MAKITTHIVVALLIGLSIFSYAKMGSRDTESYPNRPIRVIVPYNPGGGTDTYARILQKAIKDNDLMPQQLVIVNKPGGGATIGSTYVIDSRNDGYTILCNHEALMTSKVIGQSPYGPEAFEVVAATGESGLAVLVSENSPFKTMTEFMEAAKAKPETLKLGVNLGTPTHFCGIQLEETLPGARFRLVSTGGGANRLAALMGGHLDAALFSVGELIRFRENGLRPLAYLGEERVGSIPDIPTAKELGYPVFSGNLQYWWFPKGTDPEIVSYMAGVLKSAMETEYVKKRSAELEILPRTIAGAELAERITQKMSLFSRMKVPSRVELPDVTFWSVAAALALGLVVLSKAVFNPKKTDGETSERKLRFDLAFGVIGLCVLYVFLMGMGLLPFVWATILFILVSGLYLTNFDRNKVYYVFEVALGMSFGLHFIFTQLFAIQLP